MLHFNTTEWVISTHCVYIICEIRNKILHYSNLKFHSWVRAKILDVCKTIIFRLEHLYCRFHLLSITNVYYDLISTFRRFSSRHCCFLPLVRDFQPQFEPTLYYTWYVNFRLLSNILEAFLISWLVFIWTSYF